MGNLITIDDVLAELPIREGNSEFDDKINRIINAVEGLIEKACRRSFTLGTYSEIFNVQAGARRHYDFFSDTNTDGTLLIPDGVPYVLTEAPLVDATTVAVYYDLTHRFTDDTALFSDDFVVLPEKECVYINRPLVKSRDSVKIVYQGGYAEVPDEIKLAATMQVLHLFQRSTAENVSTSSDKNSKTTRGFDQYTIKGGLLPEVVNMLVPFRRILRGRG
jgi:hypothetical protein